MNKLLKLAIFTGGLGLALFLLGLSGGEVNGKPITIYSLTKLNKDKTYKISSNLLKGIASSKDGEYVYLMGQRKAMVKVLEVSTAEPDALWKDPLGDWKKIPQAGAHRKTVDLSAYAVLGYEPYHDGVMLTLSGNQGLIIIKGVDAASRYKQDNANYPNGLFAPMMVHNHVKDAFVYLLPGEQVAAPVRRILFRAYVEPPHNDTRLAWDNSLRSHAIRAMTQDHMNNLLIADKDGIKRIKEQDLGKPNKSLDNGGNPIISTHDFMLDGKSKNDHINTMALVNERFLVVGLRSTNAHNGGLAIADITKKTPQWTRFGDGLGLNVESVATRRTKEATRVSAVINTNKGWLFMGPDGQILEPIAGKGFVVDFSAINNNRADKNSYDKAQSGFLGDRVTTEPAHDGYRSAAQDKNGLWYLVLQGQATDDGGVYMMDVRTDFIPQPIMPPLPIEEMP